MAAELDYLNPARHARAVLTMRLEVQKSLEEARVSGDRKAAKSWESELRKVNKLIAQYGFDRFA